MNKLFYYFLIFPLFGISQNNYVLEYSHTNKNDFTSNSYLYINNQECLYKVGDNRPSGEIVTKGGGVDFITNDNLSEFFYYSGNKAYHRFLHSNLEWFYTDQLEIKLNWTINSSVKKKIKQYNCTEAKLKINGRDYTVWFTYEIPFKFGPLKLHNLPGMIVEIIEDTGFVKISLVSYKKVDVDKEIEPYKKYIAKWKNMSDYKTCMNDLSKYELGVKLKSAAYAKEMKVDDLSFYLDDAVIDYFLDVPDNLLENLKKIR